jgi:hypothetical protein
LAATCQGLLPWQFGHQGNWSNAKTAHASIKCLNRQASLAANCQGLLPWLFSHQGNWSNAKTAHAPIKCLNRQVSLYYWRPRECAKKMFQPSRKYVFFEVGYPQIKLSSAKEVSILGIDQQLRKQI